MQSSIINDFAPLKGPLAPHFSYSRTSFGRWGLLQTGLGSATISLYQKMSRTALHRGYPTLPVSDLPAQKPILPAITAWLCRTTLLSPILPHCPLASLGRIPSWLILSGDSVLNIARRSHLSMTIVKELWHWLQITMVQSRRTWSLTKNWSLLLKHIAESTSYRRNLIWRIYFLLYNILLWEADCVYYIRFITNFHHQLAIN